VLVLNLVQWIESGAWTRTHDDLRRALRKRPIAKTATEQLGRRWKKLVKRGKRLDALSPRKRHKLRIAAKKLRYASEFFAGIFPWEEVAAPSESFRRPTEGIARLPWRFERHRREPGTERPARRTE
jgi:CHAD domain-containing protein